MLIAGIDLSTRQLDAAIIPLDDTARGLPPVTFRTQPLLQGDRAERIRSVHEAVRVLLRDVDGYAIMSVWVEEPFGAHRNTDRALLPIMGAIIASVPSHATVAAIGVQEWRRTLGLPGNLSKQAAVDEAHGRLPMIGAHLGYLTDHMAEALLVSLAGRTLCWKASAA